MELSAAYAQNIDKRCLKRIRSCTAFPHIVYVFYNVHGARAWPGRFVAALCGVCMAHGGANVGLMSDATLSVPPTIVTPVRNLWPLLLRIMEC